MSDVAARRLLRALRRSAAADGAGFGSAEQSWTPWASVTFTGARHRVELAGLDAAEAWLEALPERVLEMPGFFVAEAAVVAREAGGAVIEALVLAE